MGYPTATDLLTKFAAEGFTIPSGFDAQHAIDTAIYMWEVETGFVPFLNVGLANTTRTFDPPGPYSTFNPQLSGGKQILRLDGGLLGPPTVTFLSGGSPQTLTEGSGFYRLLTNNHWPCLALRFTIPLRSSPNGVSVTGPWGFCDVLPSPAWTGILAYAVYVGSLDLQAAVAGTGTQGIVEERVGDVMRKFGSSTGSEGAPLKGFGNMMRDNAIELAKAFRRPVGI